MGGEVIIVGVDATKEITDYALQWAVSNVTNNMDSLILLALLPSSPSPSPTNIPPKCFLSRLLKKRGLEKQRKSAGHGGPINALQMDSSHPINQVCMHMMRRLCVTHNKQVHSEVKIIADAHLGSVAAEARKLNASWVILDRPLKKEGDCCLKQLNCNIVIIDHAIPKILRAVNPLAGKKLGVSLSEDQGDPTVADMLGVLPRSNCNYNSATTPSSLGIESPTSDTDPSMSLSSSEKEQFYKSKTSPSKNKLKSQNPLFHLNSDYFYQEVKAHATVSLSSLDEFHEPPNMASKFGTSYSPHKSHVSSMDGKIKHYSSIGKVNNIKVTQAVKVPVRRSAGSTRLLQKPESPNQLKHLFTSKNSLTNNGEDKPPSPSSAAVERTSSIRRAVSISIKHPPTHPPLCSICKHNAPVMGRTARKFSYKEIEVATDGFSSKNLLAEGGYGSVYKGILPDGQIVAVKQHKTLSAQGASEFCSEVEVLSCAQHRNLVMLVGYCIATEWLLIYEFACNGSLDKHLYGLEMNDVMAWEHRMKVAIGAARGLRYLHEDCRVGCIVHRDFRPNNILLTHDFEPMVGDFGLARWQADGQSAEETRVIGAFGYLAPEYTQTGLITEKTDVYSFGVVLLELLSGTKATDFSRSTGQQFVSEWGHPLLERNMINEIMDPRLKQNYKENEVECMMFAARLCTSLNPEKRPRMSKVLRILEGDMITDLAYNYGKQTSNYPKQCVNNIYGEETLLIPKLDHNSSSLLTQPIQHMNQSPSRTSVHRNNDLNSTFKTLTPASDSNVSHEYQTYLQGSLAKFIQNWNGQ